MSYWDFWLLGAALTLCHFLSVLLVPMGRRVVRICWRDLGWPLIPVTLFQVVSGLFLFPFVGLGFGIAGFCILWAVLGVLCWRQVCRLRHYW